jgi:hypothetical protein
MQRCWKLLRFFSETIHVISQRKCDWYADLILDPIDSWEQLEHEFLNRLHKKNQILNIVELINSD